MATTEVQTRHTIAGLKEATSQTTLNQTTQESQAGGSIFGFKETLSQTELRQFGSVEAQTASSAFRVNEAISQTAISTFQRKEIDAQTQIRTFADHSLQYGAATFQRKESMSQTALNSADQEAQTFVAQLRETDSQTQLNVAEQSIQIGASVSQQKEVVSQTDVRESKPIAAQTKLSLFALRECDSQTLVKQYAERSIQTLILGLLITDTEVQTSKFAIHDIGIQIGVAVLDESLQTEVAVEDEAVQSQGLPEWWAARQTQTDYFDTWETASQVSTAVSEASSQTAAYLSIYGQDAEVQVETLRMRRVIQLQPGASGEEGPTEEYGESEEEHEKQEMAWNPRDGRHVEKQKSVKKLLKRFEKPRMVKRVDSQKHGGQGEESSHSQQYEQEEHEDRRGSQ